MNTTIIKLREDYKNKPDNSASSLLFYYLFKLLFFWIPRASPDYEGVVDSVRYWHIEIDNNTRQAEREIGFDSFDQPIVFGPTNRNHGLWTDSDRIFNVSDYQLVDVNEFDDLWNSLGGKQGDNF